MTQVTDSQKAYYHGQIAGMMAGEADYMGLDAASKYVLDSFGKNLTTTPSVFDEQGLSQKYGNNGVNNNGSAQQADGSSYYDQYEQLLENASKAQRDLDNFWSAVGENAAITTPGQNTTNGVQVIYDEKGKRVNAEKAQAVQDILDSREKGEEFGDLTKDLQKMISSANASGWDSFIGWFGGNGDVKKTTAKVLEQLDTMSSLELKAYQEHFKNATGQDLTEVLQNNRSEGSNNRQKYSGLDKDTVRGLMSELDKSDAYYYDLTPIGEDDDKVKTQRDERLEFEA